jgi:SAM-dependent methyltransferase
MYWTETPAVPSTLPLLPEVLAALRPDDRILDVGCGAGRILNELAGQGLGRLRCGLDINLPSLRQAGGKGLPVFLADVTAHLPVADAAFDVGFLHAVLTTLVPASRRLAVLAEVRRVVGRGLAVADFLQNWDLPLYRQRYETGLAETGETGSFLVREAGRVLYPAHHFTLGELTALLSEAGFAVTFVDTPLVRTRSGNVVRGVVLTARTV